MASHLCLSITFLQPVFHGQRDDDEPEWPPSPLRLFQALVAAAAARWSRDDFTSIAVPALSWLAKQGRPQVVAPTSHHGVPVRIAVPNNDMDVPAGFWAQRVDPPENKTPQRLKTMKTVCPTHLLGGDMVFYTWELSDTILEEHAETIHTLTKAARSVVALGWGLDLVAGNASILSGEEVARFPGERWLPMPGLTDDGLRVPRNDTLDALIRRHADFLGRLTGSGLTPVPPLRAFDVVKYQRETAARPRPVVAFELWQTAEALADAPSGRSRFRPFDTTRSALSVALGVRLAAAEAAHVAQLGQSTINSLILGRAEAGHGRSRGGPDTPRLAYLPLPSLERHGRSMIRCGSVRRVLVAESPGGTGEHAAWARRFLSGQELIAERPDEPGAMLSPIPNTDANVRPYLASSPVWSTVTPVVLPGHDDDSPTKAENLLRRAIEHAGYSPTLASHAFLEWRRVGFLAGVDLSTRYQVPDYLQEFPRYHVRICWRDANRQVIELPGPVVIGAGRYVGLGLFATV